jgi:hypothetical protein
MSARLVLPKEVVVIGPNEIVFFLAGPINGGGDWQRSAIRQLAQKAPNAYIVCPCRYGSDDPLQDLAIRGESEDVWMARGLPSFPRQTLWERYYLWRAGQCGRGCVIFWLPEEDLHCPRTPETASYARDTRGELGEWRVYMMRDDAHVSLGAERGFPGLSVIEANHYAMLGDRAIIHTTLKETIDFAIVLAETRTKK